MKPIQYIPYLGTFSLGLASVYLAFFWSEFGIDIFQFLSVSDYIGQALSPLMVALTTLALGFLIFNIFILPIFSLKIFAEPTDEECTDDKGNLAPARRLGNVLVTSVLSGYGMYYLITGKTILMHGLGFVFILFALMEQWTRKNFKKIDLRLLKIAIPTIILIGLLPFVAKMNADSLKNSSMQVKRNAKTREKTVLVGRAGNYFFF